MTPLRLLLVDDDQVDRLAVKRLVRQAGIEATFVECADPASALAAIRTDPFDCILLDYHLPGTDGLELLRDLRNSGVTLPVVALTGLGDEEVAVGLMKAGAADYLNKNSLTPERLERSLRYAIALQRAEDERRQLLEREQQARLEAQAANKAKDEFLATLSHELRTPLNAILGWARLLATGQLDQATSRRAVEIIERNTRLQAQLIEDLLDVSRIITGKLRLELRAVSLRSIVEGALESVRPSADARNVTLSLILDDANETLLCDPSRMQQVIWNLLTNAIKFTPASGVVTVTAGRVGGLAVVTVTDTGAGISESFLPHVFDRFRQQDAATTRSHGGLGLGLSIVRHLVELHGGTVEASSPGQGHGATFTVTVPVAPLRTEQIVSSALDSGNATSESTPSLAGLHVLVVDNEADARALVAAILERCGARVTTAESVAEAIEQVRAQRPDVLVSDIAMPGEDGYELIRKLRMLDGPQLPAAALTAFATSGDRARALLAGYQAHLPKPVEPSELAAVIATLAGRTVQQR